MSVAEQLDKKIKPNVILAIPAYNEEKYIAGVVRSAKKFIDKIFVIDDASIDKTSKIAKDAGARVIRHKKNLRYGGAIKTCFEVAKANVSNVLVILDGDGQHDPKDIPIVLNPILDGKADIVIGSRFLDKNNKVPLYRQFGINIINLLFNIGSKMKVTDSQSGFRAYNQKAIDLLGPFHEDCMGISVEIIIQARKKRLKIIEVPIDVKYFEDSSTINPIVHGLSVALNVVKLRAQIWS